MSVRRRKAILAAAMAALVASIAAGCGSATGSEPAGSANPAPPQSAVSPQAIRVMLWGNSVDIASIKEPAQGFIDTHPEIEVTFETGDCAVDYAACKTLVAGGNMPDVVVTGSWNYYQMASDGVLADLGPYVQNGGLDLTDFTPAVIRALTSPADGKVHALPMGYNIQSLYYNKDMFAAAGLEEPPADGSYTYDDLREWAKLLTLDATGNNATSPDFDPSKIVQYGYFNFAAAPIEPGYAPVLKAFGGGILGGELRNECTADSAGTIAGFQYLQDLMWKDHSTITPQLQQEEPGYLRWVRGQVAMQQGSHEQVLLVKDQNPDLNYDMAALPAGPAGNATLFQIHTWAMYEGSNAKDAAWEFIRYMATDGSGKQMGLIPAYRDVALGEDFAKAPGEPANLIAAQIDPAGWDLTFTNTDPSAVWSAVSSQDGVGPAIEDIITNRKTAADALTGVCETRINPILDASR